MANSTIKLYTTNITPERNCKVDDIATYLESCNKMTIGSFQYSKILLDDTIKLDWNQNELPNFPFNYLSIKKSDDINDKTYYYFILNNNWKSQNTVELQISLDTINTFWNDLSWTAKTNITRQHKDRFKKRTNISSLSGAIQLYREIDKFDEGITPVKFLSSSYKKNDAAGDYDFYLIYKNAKDASSEPEPIYCYVCASEIIKVHSDSATGIYAEQLKNIGDSVYFSTTDNPDFYYHKGQSDEIHFQQNGTVRAALLVKTADGMDLFYVTTAGIPTQYVKHIAKTTVIFEDYQLSGTYFTPAEVIYPPTQTYYNFSILEQKAADEFNKFVIGDAYIQSIDSVDRTDTKIVKIIKMPYAPFDLTLYDDGSYKLPSGYIIADGFFRVQNLNTEFLNTIDNDVLNNELVKQVSKSDLTNYENINHDISMESKLYNSNFYSLKYYYDNFNKEFLLERYTPIDYQTAFKYPYVEIKFKQSNNISSSSLFDLQIKNATYKEPNLYGEYMNVNRQNEVALYTNDYLNYIRNGYNYDKKAKSLSNTASRVNTALSTVGAFVSFASSIYTGAAGLAAGISFATSAFAALSSTIVTVQQNETALQQRLTEERTKASSVSNTEDLNLLAYYNGNRLISTREICSDEMRDAIYNLFRLTGYACNEYGVPNFDNRIHYNFVQCKAAFDESSWRYGQDFLNDIRSRFEIGVTVYHKTNDSYDWLQEKENFESWMIQ